jgi:hypothetical protein
LFLVAAVLLRSDVNAQNLRTDQWLSEPVDQQTFATYLDFFRYEAALPFDAQVRVDQEGELAVERLTFTSTQAERVTANLYHPQGAAFGLRSVVFIHGGGPLGKDGPVELTGLLARAGWTVLAFDMKHYGERRTNVLTTYSPQDKADNLYNRPSLYLQWMTQNVKDAGRALDYLVREIQPRGASRHDRRGCGSPICGCGASSRRTLRRQRDRAPSGRVPRELHRPHSAAAAVHDQRHQRQRLLGRNVGAPTAADRRPSGHAPMEREHESRDPG